MTARFGDGIVYVLAPDGTKTPIGTIPSAALHPAEEARAPLEPPFVVWLGSEGLPISPILCCDGAAATRLVEQLSAARICHEAALVPCCRTDGTACPRDQWDDDEVPIDVLRGAARAHGIAWPTDVAPAPDAPA